MKNKNLETKKRASREVGKVLVNFGNLTFASFVLGSIIKDDYDRFLLLVTGGVLAVVFIALGVFLLTNAGGGVSD